MSAVSRIAGSNVIELVHSNPTPDAYDRMARTLDELAARDGVEMVNWWLWQQQIRLTCQRIKEHM